MKLLIQISILSWLISLSSGKTTCFRQRDIAESDIQSVTTLGSHKALNETECARFCSAEENCHSFYMKQAENGFDCELRGAFAQCPHGMPEPEIIYYESDRPKFPASRTFHYVFLEPSESRKFDCSSTLCPNGFLLGFSKADMDTDQITCGTYGGDLEVDLLQTFGVGLNGNGNCPSHMVVTGLVDDSLQQRFLTCSPLRNGWSVNRSLCENVLKAQSFTCPEVQDVPNVVVAVMAPNGPGVIAEAVTCCQLRKS